MVGDNVNAMQRVLALLAGQHDGWSGVAAGKGALTEVDYVHEQRERAEAKAKPAAKPAAASAAKPAAAATEPKAKPKAEPRDDDEEDDADK